MSRKVRVAAFTDKKTTGERTVQENLDWATGIIDRIAAEKPDLIALTETFNTRSVPKPYQEVAERLDGPTMQALRAKAREHGTYIVPCFLENRGGQIYNTAVVIDRNGNVAGQYDKIHPTNSEIDNGVVPGQTEPVVIETDFGKIGCQICFDANWHRDWQSLVDAGAEMILFLSAYPAGRVLSSMATLYHVPIVAANTPTCCSIIDIDGLTLTRQGIYRQWVIATLDLDTPLFHLDYQFDKMEQIRVKYADDVNVRVYEEEAWWRIEPYTDAVSVPDIIKEFDLEILQEYLARSTAYQVKARRDARIEPAS